MRKSQPPTARLIELDSLRGLAAICIVFWHYSSHFHVQPLGWLLRPFYGNGWIFVDFFFVLSGFVLGRTYISQSKSIAFIKNIKHRLSRLYPLHFLTLLAAALGQLIIIWKFKSPFVYEFNDIYHFILNLLLLNQSGLERGLSFNGPAWAVSSEFMINILFFSIITLPRKWVVVAFVLLLLASFALLIPKGVLTSDVLIMGFIDPSLLRTAMGFFMGTLLALGMERRKSRFSYSSLADIVSLAMLITIVGYLAWKPMASAARSDFILVLIIFPTLMLSIIGSNFIKKFLQLKLFVILGAISYSIYLWQFPLELASRLVAGALQTSLPYGQPWFLVIYMTILVIISGLSYKFIEQPTKRYFAF